MMLLVTKTITVLLKNKHVYVQEFDTILLLFTCRSTVMYQYIKLVTICFNCWCSE
jgi:hypothetical protein